MNAWAQQFPDVQFLCVCVVAGNMALAREMGAMSKLTHCVNGVVERNEEMPSYGQLGCSGFMVVDSGFKVQAPCTSSFMQVRELAFKHVETVVDAVLKKQAIPSVCPGEFADIISHHDGKVSDNVVCLGLEGDMVVVASLRSKQVTKVLPTNLRKVDPDGTESDEDYSEGQGQACGPGGCGPGACGPGGCGPVASSGATGAPRQVAVPTLGVPEMDAEHQECAAVLDALLLEPTKPRLRAVLRCFEEHFKHEEQLLRETCFGGAADGPFSAQKVHREDHQRILTSIKMQLDSQCPVRAQEVVAAFTDHADKFDSTYASHLQVH
mmetsp:Transcript_37225/g.89505  ORF Transcript_37225/g.89505 Transcript_37225/m.89505 type:complete len:323 (-) Transcript_37225:260-1228(-)